MERLSCVSPELTPKIGVIGAGFIARGLTRALRASRNFEISRVLSRRHPEYCEGFGGDVVTNSVDDLIEHSDIIVECSGDPVYATPVVRSVLQSGIPVVTMDTELHITTGTYLNSIGGYLTEAEGDQPGSLAALANEATAMGFDPIVYGNVKGFLNYNPTHTEMTRWANMQGISLEQVTSFTDGTKVQMEQVLVANGLNADIAPGGMIGGQQYYDGFKEGAFDLAECAETHNIRMSDFLMCKSDPSVGRDKAPPGVFIVARHNEDQAEYLKYYKLGEGPHYLLERPFHLCHLEVMKTLLNVVNGHPPLLTNGQNPKYSVAAVAKRSLSPGERIHRGLGGFDVRGEGILIESDPDHVPIGLLFDILMKNEVGPGEIVRFDDVEIPESEALAAWKSITTVAQKVA